MPFGKKSKNYNTVRMDSPYASYMQQAFLLAQRGLYTTHPNPRVGCILVKDGQVVGTGWHEKAGLPHAEIIALNTAGTQAKDATCYVTLEPCCHHGRTPPCTTALIAAGIKQVVIAAPDPNPHVSGKGILALQQAGIEVIDGILEKTAERLNPGFFKRMRLQKPYVRCKLAMSVDGRTAASNGESQWITGDAARQDVQHWRAQSSGIVTGINTILSDDPLLTVREISVPKQPLRIILDTHLKIPEHAKILQDVDSVIIFTASTENPKIKTLQKKGIKTKVIAMQADHLDVSQVLTVLAEEFEQNELLLEAGPTLSGAFLKAGFIDELILYVAPKILGHLAKPLFYLPLLNTLQQAITLKIQTISQCGEDWRIIFAPN